MIKKTNMCILMGDETVDVVYVDRTMLGLQVRFMERLANNADVFGAVAALMQTVEKMPSRVTLCVPRADVMQRTLRYPLAAGEEIDSMIRFEAARHVPLPEEDRLLAWSVVELPETDQLLLNIAAARKSEVRALIERFEEAGVPIDEAAPFSAIAARELSEVPTLLVLSDVRHVEICLCGQQALQDSLLIRRDAADFSEERLISAARQMAAKHKNWLGDEGIARILSGGIEPLTESLEAEFETAFGLHVHRLEAPREFVPENDQPPLCDVLFVASITLPPTMNLIEDRQRKVPMNKRTVILSALCTLLAVELVAVFAFKTAAPVIQRRKVAAEIEEMQRETARAQEMRSKNQLFRKQLYQLERVCSSHAGAMEILKTLSDTLPENTYLNRIRCGQEEIEIRGRAMEPEKLPELMMSIPFIDRISTSDIGSENNDYYDVSLSATLRR